MLLLLVSVLGLALGLLLGVTGLEQWQGAVWAATAGIVLAALLAEILGSLRRGEFGLDIVAALSMSVAIAFGENLAAAVVALMYSGGQLLEAFASNRATAEMKALLDRVPKSALRYQDGTLESCAISALRPGDRVLVRQGEVVPVDGRIASGAALLDLAALTGESVPVKLGPGRDVQSGSLSLDMAFDLEVTRTAEDSAYSGIVRLVRDAQAAKAPMVRLADRYAIWFLVLTLAIAGLAYFATGDRLRLLAVLVVATPCPLILAVPVAIISGISRAAGRGVLLKGGPVLETLAKASVLVIDKTGTLTHGKAQLTMIEPRAGWTTDDVLTLAASLDQASNHVMAHSIVAAARDRGLRLNQPDDARETAGEGIAGHVNGRRVIVGGDAFVRRLLKRKTLPRASTAAEAITVAVAVDGKLAGHLILEDTIREEAAQALTRLRAAGVGRIVLATGDTAAVAKKVGAALGLDEVRPGLAPAGKVETVIAERRHGTVLMAGDGVNDAPALAAADVGIAMGARGSAASAEAADAVLLVDRLERIADAVEIARRSRGIAIQSVVVGLGLSVLAMIAAALGYLSVLEGALLQEAIDLAVILNALRALR